MDPNEDPAAVEQWETSSVDSGPTPGATENNQGGNTKTPKSTRDDIVANEVNLLVGIIKGTHRWSKYLDSNENFKDIRFALQIVYGYHPRNDGSDSRFPKATLGNIERMREDAMHLSSLGCFLAAQASAYETSAANMEQERKLQRSVTWTDIKRKIYNGDIVDKMTQDDIKHAAEVSAADLYRLECELRKLGRMYSWVRAAVRTFVETLDMLVKSSMREERGDARLN